MKMETRRWYSTRLDIQSSGVTKKVSPLKIGKRLKCLSVGCGRIRGRFRQRHKQRVICHTAAPITVSNPNRRAYQRLQLLSWMKRMKRPWIKWDSSLQSQQLFQAGKMDMLIEKTTSNSCSTGMGRQDTGKIFTPICLRNSQQSKT